MTASNLNRRSLQTFFAAGAFFGLSIISASSFAPKNWYPPGAIWAGETHQSITEAALKQFDSITFPNFTITMERAISDIVDANANVDDDQRHSSLHFDGENFRAGQYLILGLRAKCIAALVNRNSDEARFTLGRALHTIQDFYSHSTWVENNGAIPNPFLGVPGKSIQSVASDDTITCGGGTAQTTLLTSGYYAGYSEEVFGAPQLEDRQLSLVPPYIKCIHGGPKDWYEGRYAPSGINKDSSWSMLSGHYTEHGKAASAARQATVKFLTELAADLTSDQLALLLGADITSGDRITIVDSQLSDLGPWMYITDTRTGLILSSNNDHQSYLTVPRLSGNTHYYLFINVEWAKTTDESYAFIFLRLPNYIHLVTAPGSPPWSPHYSLTTDPNEILISWRISSGLYDRIEFEIGASMMAVGENNAVDDRPVTLLSITNTWDGTFRTNVVSVDHSVSQIDFYLAGKGVLNLYRPSGIQVGTNDADTFAFIEMETAVYSLTNPVPGAWQIVTAGTNAYSIDVSGHAGIAISLIEFVEPGGGGAHPYFARIPGSPLRGTTNTAVFTMVGAVSNVECTLRAPSAVSLMNPSVVRGVDSATNEFLTQSTLPDTPFLFYVTGVDALGTEFQRVVRTPLLDQPLEVRSPHPFETTPAKNTTCTFSIINHGTADYFVVQARDSKSIIQTATPFAFTLAPGESTNVAVTLKFPVQTPPGTSDLITLTVASTSFASVSNSASVQVSAYASPILAADSSNGELTLWWTGVGILQTAPDLNGPWADVATPPNTYTLQMTNNCGFFRVRQ